MSLQKRVRRVLRTFQVHFPGLREAKFAAFRISRRALSRPHEPDFAALRLFPESLDGDYLDVGANRGQSIDSIKLFRPTARLLAFEPNAHFAERLRARYGDRDDVEILEFALGEREDSITLHVPAYRGFVFDGLASLSEEAATAWLRTTALLSFDERHLSVETVHCELKRLDDLELAPSFVKIDTEGTELGVLRGGERTLREHRPVLLIEGVDPRGPVHEFLVSLGYRAYAFRRGCFIEGDTSNQNSFLIHEERRPLFAGRIRNAG